MKAVISAASESLGGAGEGRVPLRYGRGSVGRTEALVA